MQLKYKLLKIGQPLGLMLLTAILCSELSGCAAAAVSGAATTVALAADRRTAGTIIDDQAIEIKAVHALSKDRALWKDSHISVVSYNNSVLLLGQTSSPHMKQQAESYLREIPRVGKIYNELTTEEPVSLGVRTQDSWITTQIKAKMIGKKAVNPAHVKVITENGVVYLLGITKRDEQIAATEIARSVSGVKKVVQIFEHT